MMANQKQLIGKGVFAVAIVAATAVVGVIGYAKAADGAVGSGYGTSSQQALAAADTFDQQQTAATNEFQADVRALVAAKRSQLSAGGQLASGDYANSFDAASTTYDSDVKAAEFKFRTAINASASKAESKDKFIDDFNHAKADYMNSLEAAKNTFADMLNRSGDAVVKDQFMNEYNTTKDAYGNQLEVFKNQFAATLG